MSCEDCKDTGWVFEGTQRKECKCKLKERVIKYLTPKYEGAMYVSTFSADKVDKRDVFIESPNIATFKKIMKSFLINTAMKYSHETVSAYEVLQAYLSNSESRNFFKLTEVDVLAIVLIQDPHNRHYGNILTSLLQARAMYGKHTWIYSTRKVESPEFVQMYGAELVEYIRKGNFLVLAGLA